MWGPGSRGSKCLQSPFSLRNRESPAETKAFWVQVMDFGALPLLPAGGGGVPPLPHKGILLSQEQRGALRLRIYVPNSFSAG